jgi:hypothetical protein
MCWVYRWVHDFNDARGLSRRDSVDSVSGQLPCDLDVVWVGQTGSR